MTRYERALLEAAQLTKSGETRKSKSYLFSFLYSLMRDGEVMKALKDTLDINPHVDVEFSDPFLFDKAEWLADQLTKERPMERAERRLSFNGSEHKEWTYWAIDPDDNKPLRTLGSVTEYLNASDPNPVVWSVCAGTKISDNQKVKTTKDAFYLVEQELKRCGWQTCKSTKKMIRQIRSKKLVEYRDAANPSRVAGYVKYRAGSCFQDWSAVVYATGGGKDVDSTYDTKQEAVRQVEREFESQQYRIVSSSAPKKEKPAAKTYSAEVRVSRSATVGRVYEVVADGKVVGDLYQTKNSAVLREQTHWRWRSMVRGVVLHTGTTTTETGAWRKLTAALAKRGYVFKTPAKK